MKVRKWIIRSIKKYKDSCSLLQDKIAKQEKEIINKKNELSIVEDYLKRMREYNSLSSEDRIKTDRPRPMQYL